MPEWAGPGSMPLYRLRITNAEQGYTRPSKCAVELLAGDVASADGQPLRLRLIVDRRGDRYVKELTDPQTGAVSQSVRKKLSEHQDHGSAKPGYRPQRGARPS
jgi:hypothetical protein